MRFKNRHYVLLCSSFILLMGSGCSNQSIKSNSVQSVQIQLNETHPSFAVDLYLKNKSTTINALIAQPLTPQTSVQIMLLNSPRIEAELTKLGVLDAAQVQAGLISNPRFSFALLKPENSNHWLWDLGLTQPLVELLTRSTRKQQADDEAMEAQLGISRYLQTTISELEQQYFSAIADQQKLVIQKKLLDAELAKKELAENIYKAGNISQLNYLAYLSRSQQQERALTSQQLEAMKSKSNLEYLLGFTTEPIELPTNLPVLSQENFDANALIDAAKNNRLDVKLALQHQKLLNTQLTLIKKEYGISDSSVGVMAKREVDGTRSNGVQAEIAIPIFDNGQAKISAMNARIFSAQANLKDIQTSIARDIQQSIAMLNVARVHYAQLELEHATAEKRIELMQQEINFMLSSPFELIELKTQSILLEQEKTHALLSYWQARSQLELAVGKQLSIENTGAQQ